MEDNNAWFIDSNCAKSACPMQMENLILIETLLPNQLTCRVQGGIFIQPNDDEGRKVIAEPKVTVWIGELGCLKARMLT